MDKHEKVQLVWFKRDLRIADHRPLREAARRGRCLCLYVYEPEFIGAEDFDACHLDFINESLRELRENLQQRGGELLLRVGALPDVFAALHREHSIEAIWCHQETGNQITYARDTRVIRWCRDAGVAHHEIPQNGVVRRLKDRDGWSRTWSARMSEPVLAVPDHIASVEVRDRGDYQTPPAFQLAPSTKHGVQPGGESIGKETLRSFLNTRGKNYSSEMSSPVTAEESCSRLSPYIAWGCLSIKQIHQAAERRSQAIRRQKSLGTAAEPGWLKSLAAFQGRLRWHCHFAQKLEDEPRIEFENVNRAFDGLREDEFNEAYFQAWQRGETGYPMVDACMRSLHHTGWVNFRMRAMLVSFASYHLWLHWRRPALYLAKQFVDYEPGIHYSQFQMQAGVTGINAVRIYSPIKQVQDQDPEGRFIRRYVPELAEVPPEYLAEPHKMPPILQQDVGCVIGQDYPEPIVPHAAAYAEAKQRMYAFRKRAAVREQSQHVLQKHGSRRRMRRR
ncbi:MAG: deoxyribodipyrimidine photo-lyase/cryptochrome family protein [Planctomycetota bacterium]